MLATLTVYTIVYVPSPLSVTISLPATNPLSTLEKSPVTAYPAASTATETVIVSPFVTRDGAAEDDEISGAVLSSVTPASELVAAFPAASPAVTGMAYVPSAVALAALTV